MRRTILALALAAVGLMPMPATAGSAHQCFGEVPTVVGTHGDDNLSGDVVVGRGGTDAIRGRLVCGNSGDDYDLLGYMVNGGPGHDFNLFVQGPIGVGGSGNDYMLDGPFDGQVFYGGDGDDELVLARDATPPDTTHVQPDIFYGGTGNDDADQEGFQETRLYGQEGNDVLRGGLGRDNVFGGPGDDYLQSSWSNVDDEVRDVLRGGDGFDTCFIDPGDKVFTCEDVTVRG